MKTWLRSIGLLLAPPVLLLAQHAGGGGGHAGSVGGGHAAAAAGSSHAGAGGFHAAGYGLPPIAAPRPTPSVGLSPPSIGLSPQSFGSRARPVYPSFSRSPYNYSRYGHRNNRVLPYAFVGAPFLPFDYGQYSDDYGYDDAAAAEAAPPALGPGDASPADSQLSAQVAQLSAQLNDLQNQLGQPAGQAGVPSDTPQADESVPAPPPVTVVLNNGKSLTVQNYAVVGDTFWDFSSQPARHIALSQINIPASAQASEAAGAEFPKIGK